MSKLYFKNSFALLTVAFLVASGFLMFAGTVSADDAVLGVTQTLATQPFATADGTYANGWSWVFDVTVPINETILNMKFTDWVSGSNIITAGSHIRFYSAQSSNAFNADNAITISAADNYSGEMDLTGDRFSNIDGRQIQITVEAAVPIGSAGGSYSTGYGIQTNPDTTVPVNVPVTGVSLNESSRTLAVNDTDQLTVTIVPTDATNQHVTWSSSSPIVATVDATGKITAVGTGSAKIAVITEDGSFPAIDYITVQADLTAYNAVLAAKIGADYTTASWAIYQAVLDDNVVTNQDTQAAVDAATTAITTAQANLVRVGAVTGVSLNEISRTLIVGETDQLIATIAPADATNQNVTWSSGAPIVATVDSTGKITAVGTGSAKIAVITEDGSFTATDYITVN